MKGSGFVVPILAAVTICGCGSAGVAETYKWTLIIPATVDKGTDLVFQVRSHDPQGIPVEGVRYTYLIQWPGGGGNPLRHSGKTWVDEKIRARMISGTATIIVTCEGRTGAQVRATEGTFEVK